MGCWEDSYMLVHTFDLAGKYIDVCDPVYFVAKEFYADCSV